MFIKIPDIFTGPTYIVGIICAWYLLVLIAKKHRLWANDESPFTPQNIEDLMTYLILGIILGGRLGYVLFYNLNFYLNNLLDIFKIWQGRRSFHGGLIGIIIVSIWFAKKNNHNPFKYLDIVSYVAPIGIFFGRIANFINSELYGTETNIPWAVKFLQVDNLYRHPSQLYEAFFEGMVLFLSLIHI